MPHPEADRYAHKTVILVTLGSTFPFANIARHVLSAFADERFHVIVNTGDQFMIDALDAPGHHEVRPLICREFEMGEPDCLDERDKWFIRLE